MIRAFVAAKNKSQRGDKELISRDEFRHLLKYLRKYYELWIMFSRLDSDQDRRLQFEDFLLGQK
jgi:hypothetical protein